jgi:TRAP-type C4-dicarboxylate transport system permease small subunit
LGFAALVCAAMAWHSLGLVRVDLAETAQTGATTTVPTWLPESILPIAFLLMAIRFALRAFMPPAHPPALLHVPTDDKA